MIRVTEHCDMYGILIIGDAIARRPQLKKHTTISFSAALDYAVLCVIPGTWYMYAVYVSYHQCTAPPTGLQYSGVDGVAPTSLPLPC